MTANSTREFFQPPHRYATLAAMIQCLLAILFLAAAASAAPFDHSHQQLVTVLNKHVRAGGVDYKALKADSAGLDTYLKHCAAVTEPEFKQWTEAQQLAFLINVYNAATLQLVVEHYPVRSIKKIGGWFSNPWERQFVRLFSDNVTLDDIEHGMLRKNYREPRIHFALVCAAQSCPPLRSEPYTATKLNEQLEEQGRVFLRTRDSNRVDARQRTVFLSPIFKWFRQDFEANGDVLDFVAPYFTADDQKTLAAHRDWKIRFTNYDWSLNDAPRQ